jgi:hypothetical protein
MKAVKLTVLVSCLALMIGVVCRAAGQERRTAYPPGFILDRFDSFENTSVEFENAVLDSFAIALLNKPTDIGYIIVYAGRKACRGEAQARAIRMKKYVVEYRGVEWNRVMWKDGGYLERPYVLLEMQLRNGPQYPYDYPQVLPASEVQIVKCKRKNKLKRTGSSSSAHNKALQLTARQHASQMASHFAG